MKIKSVGEYQAEKAAADATPETNGQAPLTDADTEIVAAGGKVTYGASQEEDPPKEADKEAPKPPPVDDLGDIGWSEKPESINVVGVLMTITEAAGQTNVNGKVRFHSPLDPAVVAKISDALGTTFSASYAGNQFGDGVTIKQQRQFADADGDRWNDIDLIIPETQRLKLKNLIGKARSRGVLALDPLQMSLDLTKKA